ncbi:DUF4142 domain-containing protein [Roseicella frigidaeris]|nr:DUF4142 domain-containing protein [Roseicella frigidaeris]
MAVAGMVGGAGRRALLLALGAALPLLRRPAAAQGTTQGAAEAPPFDPGRFLGFAYSSAMLQERVSALAAARDTRPEVKEFAAGMKAFRAGQIERLRGVARERNLPLPAEEAFEHRVVFENLEPLDHLALSRRYAEIQTQALTQEIRGYEAAQQGPDEGMRRLAAEMLPPLRQRLEATGRMRQAVGP